MIAASSRQDRVGNSHYARLNREVVALADAQAHPGRSLAAARLRLQLAIETPFDPVLVGAGMLMFCLQAWATFRPIWRLLASLL